MILHRASLARSPNLYAVMLGPGAIRFAREPGVDVLEMHYDRDTFLRACATSASEFIAFEPAKDVRKFGCIARLFEAHDFWRDYDRIMFADDDLELPTRLTLADTFEAFASCGARIAHPGLTWDSVAAAHMNSLVADVIDPGGVVPWADVDFCELMAPMFTRDALVDYLPTFGETVMGWGLEQLWGAREREAGRRIVRLDGTPFRHSRPLGSGDAYRGLAMHPGVESLLFLSRHGLQWPAWPGMWNMLRSDGADLSPLSIEQRNMVAERMATAAEAA